MWSFMVAISLGRLFQSFTTRGVDVRQSFEALGVGFAVVSSGWMVTG